MSSWPGLTMWGLLTVLEFVGKCVPVVDQMVDSVEVFVVPWIVSVCIVFGVVCCVCVPTLYLETDVSLCQSTLGSAASFGSFGNEDEVVGNGSAEEEVADNGNDEVADGERFLSSKHDNTKVLRGRTLEATSSVGKAMTRFFQVILIFCGVVLAICLHFMKMLLRLMGTGCLTQLITIGEAITVIFGVCISVFIRQFAIVIAAFLCVGAAHGAKKKYEKWQIEEEEEGADKTHTGRFYRFFHHGQKKDTTTGDEQGESYVEMEEGPKKKHWWSRH